MIYNMLIIKAKSWGLILNIIILIFLIYSVVILQEIYRVMQVLSQSNTLIYFYWYSHLSLELSSMTDEERDQIDTDAETYMRTCSVAIQTLKNEGIDTA